MDYLFRINPFFSIKKKKGIYVFYFDFDFFFFRKEAANLLHTLIKAIDEKDTGMIKKLPPSFIEYLLEKKIIEEVNNEIN
jgi:hypothetical protein